MLNHAVGLVRTLTGYKLGAPVIQILEGPAFFRIRNAGLIKHVLVEGHYENVRVKREAFQLAVSIVVAIDNSGDKNIVKIDAVLFYIRIQIHVVVGVHAVVVRTHLHDVACGTGRKSSCSLLIPYRISSRDDGVGYIQLRVLLDEDLGSSFTSLCFVVCTPLPDVQITGEAGSFCGIRLCFSGSGLCLGSRRIGCSRARRSGGSAACESE